MERIKVIVVQRRGRRLAVVPGHNGFLEIALEADAETVLELVRAHFLDRWKAKVHALQWLFPEDFRLAGAHDQTPYLVVCAETLGQLPRVPDADKKQGMSNEIRETLLEHFRIAAESPSQAEPWSLPGWLPETSAWIRRHFPTVNRISQVRTCPNGAVLRIEVGDDSCYYLKTQTRSLAYEWALLKTLNRRAPGSCPGVLDIRPDCNTHLSDAIRGYPLDTPGVPSSLQAMALRAVANLQIRSIGFVEELCGQSIPCHPPEFLGRQLEATLNRLIHLQRESPNRLTPTESAKVAQLAAKTAGDVEDLDRGRLPEALIHGDLNWSNVLRTGTEEVALIDWSLSRVTHPFFTLGSTVFASLVAKRQMPPEHKALCDAYLEMWSDFAPQRRLRAALDAASRLFWIDSAMAVSSLCQPGHMRNLINLPRFLRAALRTYDLID